MASLSHFLLVVVLGCAVAYAQRTEPALSVDIYQDVIDHTRFDSLWHASKKFGRLNTNGVWSDAYAAYSTALAKADPEPFFVDAQLAFWINAYLALLMKSMQQRVGYRSTWWDSLLTTRDTMIVAGGKHTLKSIADTIVVLAKTVRVKAFFCTGSNNDPPFPSGACFAKKLKTQLREQLRRVVRTEKFVLYDPAGNVLQLSTFFNTWINEMEKEAGSVVDFLLPWLTEAVSAQLALRKSNLKVVVHDRMETWRRAR